MNCQTAEGMVTRYINQTLSIKELEAFLDHICTCSSCYDELETYFIVQQAIQQLNEDEDEVLDFKELLAQDIRKSRRYILKAKASRFLSALGVVLLIAVLAVFLVFVILQVTHRI